MNTATPLLEQLGKLTRSDLDAALAPPTSVALLPPPAPSPPSVTESLAALDASTTARREAARDPVRAAQDAFGPILRDAARTLALVDAFDVDFGAEVRGLASRHFLQNVYRLAGVPESLLIRLDRDTQSLARSLQYARTRLRDLPGQVEKLTTADVRNNVHEHLKCEVQGIGVPSEDMLASIRRDLAELAETMQRATPTRMQALPMPAQPAYRPEQAIRHYDPLAPSNSVRH